MELIFQNILTASFHGSILITAVIALRLLLRRAPKKYICTLWLLAGLRLLMPFELQSSLSLQPDAAPRLPTQTAAAPVQTVPNGTAPDPFLTDPAVAPSPSLAPIQSAPAAIPPAEAESSGDALPHPASPASSIWAAMVQAVPWVYFGVMSCFLLYSVYSYLHLKSLVRDAVRVRGGWESDRIETAFILGFIKPKIYIPMGMPKSVRKHILAHERTHLQKGDHWIKMVGFLALALHWFNPLVWAAYILLCKDIEMACDERVVQFMELEDRKAYSAALLQCSTNRAHFTACPVAFGEVNVKKRIRSVLNYRKPSFWISALAVVAVVFVAVTLLTSPKDGDSSQQTQPPAADTGKSSIVAPSPQHNVSDLKYYGQSSGQADPYGNSLCFAGYRESPTSIGVILDLDYAALDSDSGALAAYGGSVTFSDVYWLEKQTDTGWEALPTLTEPNWMNYTDSLANGYISFTLDWSALYGPLYDGEYRLGKTITVQGTDYSYYIPFHIYANDPSAEPEIAAAVERVNAAVHKAAEKGCYRVSINGSTETAQGVTTLQDEYARCGGNRMGSEKSWDPQGNLTTEQIYAYYDGVYYMGTEDDWYCGGSDNTYYAPDAAWKNLYLIENQHVSLPEGDASISQETVSLIIDSSTQQFDWRCYRDYCFDETGALTQIKQTLYSLPEGSLTKAEKQADILTPPEAEVAAALAEIPVKAAGKTAEEYDQRMREKSFNHDFDLGASQFLWRFDGWAFYTGGENATATGMTVNHSYISGSGTLRTEGAYWLERLEDGAWSRVDLMAGSSQPDGASRTIFSGGGSNALQVDWSGCYGALEPGFYRFAQTYASGTGKTKVCYAKFRVFDEASLKNLQTVRTGLRQALNQDTFRFSLEESPSIQDEDSYYFSETFWKQGSDYANKRYDLLTGQESYSLYIGGQGYSSDGSGWTTVDFLDKDFFELFMTVNFEMYDSYISAATRDGNTITVLSDLDLNGAPQQFVYQFNDAGALVSGQSYYLMEQPYLQAQFAISQPTQEELDRVFSKDRITKPAPFSYTEDQALFSYQNVSTGPFRNTDPVPLTTAQEAILRAKNDCTLQEFAGSGQRNPGDYNLTQAFFDEAAQMWRVEFTFSQGGVYQAVYMTADGITKEVVSS